MSYTSEEQANDLLEYEGECNGDWPCEECFVRDYINPDECTMREAVSAAEDFLNYNSRGRCKSIW